jgi:hypothetical protein
MQVGDKVRVLDDSLSSSHYSGRIGTIIEISASGVRWPFIVKFDDGVCNYRFSSYELEVV